MAKGRGRAKADHQADTRGGGFAGLPKVVMESAAYRDLSLFARAALFEILLRFNGYNNGSIAVSVRQIAEGLGNSNYRKISKAVAELIEHGLLKVNVEGALRERTAREYELTFISTGKSIIYPATNEYRQWGKSGVDDASANRPQSADDASARPPFAADAVSAKFEQIRQKTVNRQSAAADDASALIGEPYPSSNEEGIVAPSAPWDDGLPTDPYADYWDDETEPPKLDADWPDMVRDESLAAEITTTLGARLKADEREMPGLLRGIGRQIAVSPEWLEAMLLLGDTAFPIHWDRLRAFWSEWKHTA